MILENSLNQNYVNVSNLKNFQCIQYIYPEVNKNMLYYGYYILVIILILIIIFFDLKPNKFLKRIKDYYGKSKNTSLSCM